MAADALARRAGAVLERVAGGTSPYEVFELLSSAISFAAITCLITRHYALELGSLRGTAK